MAASPRMLVARLWHEPHLFNPRPTTAAQFAISTGEQSLAAVAPGGSTFDGIVQVLLERGVHVLPGFSAYAPPGGPVDHALYVEEGLSALRSTVTIPVAFDRELRLAGRESGPFRLRPASLPLRLVVKDASAHGGRLWVSIGVEAAAGKAGGRR